MSKQLDTIGRVCQQVREELNGINRNHKKYADRRKEATERLRPMLTKVWAALEAGETVNGFTKKEDWARFYNPSAKGANGIRQIQRVINPPVKKTKRHDVASGELKDGEVIIIGGKKFTIITAPESADDLMKTKVPGHFRVGMIVTPVAEPGKSPATTIPTKRLTQHTRYHKSTGDDILCGKRTGFTLSTEDDEQVNCEACLKLMSEEHTGQHDDCTECFEAYQKDEALKQLRSDAWKLFISRIQPLINTWRNRRLTDPEKYRARFNEAARKYEKRVGEDYGRMITKEARGRMEAAIASEGINSPIGTRQECETERDRINAKLPAMNDSVENPVGAVNDVAHGVAQQNQQQHPAAEALEKALDSTEGVEVSDEQHDEERCDYSEEQVAAMFVQGGK